MGATTWDYFTPYDKDVEAALQRLREQVFRDGRYERFTLDGNDSETPDTIEALLEEEGESGTHSILDIQRVSSEPDFGAVSLMPVEELVTLFGTDKPTRQMVEDKSGDYDLVEHPLVSERWQGVYFIVYRDNRPDELFFIGTSGD